MKKRFETWMAIPLKFNVFFDPKKGVYLKRYISGKFYVGYWNCFKNFQFHLEGKNVAEFSQSFFRKQNLQQFKARIDHDFNTVIFRVYH